MNNEFILRIECGLQFIFLLRNMKYFNFTVKKFPEINDNLMNYKPKRKTKNSSLNNFYILHG